METYEHVTTVYYGENYEVEAEVLLRKKILFKKLRGHQYYGDLDIYQYTTVQGTCQGVYWGTGAPEFAENTPSIGWLKIGYY